MIQRKTERVCITLKKDVINEYKTYLKERLVPLSTAINALLEAELKKGAENAQSTND